MTAILPYKREEKGWNVIGHVLLNFGVDPMIDKRLGL